MRGRKKQTKEAVAVAKAKSPSGNGHNPAETEILEQTPEQQAQLEDFKKGIKAGDIVNAFTQTHHTAPVDYLVNPGDEKDGRSLMMRTIIPGKIIEVDARITAISQALADSREFENSATERQIWDMLAMSPSRDGESRKELVKAIIGDDSYGRKNQRGAGNWLTRKVFGSKGGGGQPLEGNPE